MDARPSYPLGKGHVQTVTSRPPLPDFANPPLTEVVLGLHFGSSEPLNPAHIGLIWNAWREMYPRVENHTPIDPVVEELETPLRERSRVSFTVEDRLPVPRTWFLNVEGTELIQVQSDFFCHNWRKTAAADQYPRYEAIRARFATELNDLSEFLAREELGELRPKQCEITYINHIAANQEWSEFGHLNRIVPILAAPDGRAAFLPTPETVGLDVRYVISNATGRVGRLHVSWKPALRRLDQHPLIVMALTARGAPLELNTAGVFDFLDIGREWIVRAFAELTTESMQAVFGRKHGN